MNPLRAAIARGARRPSTRGPGAIARRPGEGYEFAQLRGYTEGDDPRRIDWAASARIGALQTRVYLDENALVFAAILDESASMRVGRKRSLLDAGCEALGAWFGAAEEEDRSRRIIDGAPVGPSTLRGTRGARVAVDARGSGTFDLSRELRVAVHVLPRGAALLVVSDFFDLTNEADDTLARAGARLDATALIASDPWLNDMPLAGFVRLRDAESGRVRRVFVGKRQRERYRLASLERDAAIRERLRAHGWRTGTLDERDGRGSLYQTFGVR